MKNGQRWLNLGAVGAVIVAFALIFAKNAPGNTNPDNQLLNVSYDATRELYQQIDSDFAADYEKRTGHRISVMDSHGGSSRQSRTVISGENPADVVTLGLFTDVDALRKRGLIANNWIDRLPNHSNPYTSTIVFVVRQGNPRNIHDWPDLIRSDTLIITPDPKTSGNGKLSALAAWGAIVTRGGSEADARAYLKTFYQHVPPVMDPGARSAALTFAAAETGDVQSELGRRGHSRSRGIERQARNRVPAGEHPGGAVRGVGRRERRSARDAGCRASVSRVSVHRPRTGNYREVRLSAAEAGGGATGEGPIPQHHFVSNHRDRPQLG